MIVKKVFYLGSCPLVYLVFSTVCCFLSTLCCKFSKSIQTLATSQLIEFLNKIPSYQPLQIECEFDAYGHTSCPNQFECKLLSPFMDSLVISHVFPHFPMTLSMFCYIWQVNKTWSMVVAKSVFWNALANVNINHGPYLLCIAKIGSSKICL